VASAVLVGCQPTGTSTAFHIGFNSWVGYSALYIAQKAGFFAKLGLQVGLTDTENLSDRIAALGGGSYSSVGATVDSSVTTSAADIPGKIVFAFDDSNGADGIIAAEDIGTIRGLVGKTVGVEEAFTDHFMLLKVLSDEGIDAGAVSIKNLTAPDAASAFEAGQIDAAAIYEPYLSQAAAKRPGSKVIYTTSQDKPFLFDVLFVPDHIIASRRDAVSSLVRALMRANDLWATSPSTYTQFVADTWNWKPSEVEAAVSQITIATSQTQKEWFLSANSPMQLAATAAADLWLKAGVIKKAVNGASLVDASFVQNALKNPL